MRKMILTGALVLLGAGTTAQIITALAVCILWLTLIANLKPFGESVDDRLAQVEGLQVLFTLLVGLVLQLEAAAAEKETASTIDDANIGILLIVLNCTVVLLALLQQPVVLLLTARVRRFARRIVTKKHAIRDWEKAWVVAPSGDEYRACLRREERGGALAVDIWCDTASHPPRALQSVPRALAFESSDDSAVAGARGTQHEERRGWHFDSDGTALLNPCEVNRVADGETCWIDVDTKRLLDAAPVALFETYKFESATAWLDPETQTLLRARPGILVFREPLSIETKQTLVVGPVWRHRTEGTITSVDPAGIHAGDADGGDRASASSSHCPKGGDAWATERIPVSVSFIYRYISRESCSQFDSLPLTYLMHSMRGRSSALAARPPSQLAAEGLLVACRLRWRPSATIHSVQVTCQVL